MSEGRGSKGKRRPVDEDLDPLLARLWDGASLRTACAEMGLDTPSTNRWLDADPDRCQQYARAREGRAHYLQEDALTINRAAALGIEVNGKKVDSGGARGYLDAVKWSTARMAPKTHGDRTVHEHSGPGGGPIAYANLSREERQARIKELEARRAERSGGA